MKRLKKITKRLKKIAKSSAICILSIVLVVPSVNIFAADAVTEYERDADGNITKINKIVIDPYTYYDATDMLGGGTEITLDTMQNVVPSLFSDWGMIAAKIFETNTDATIHNDGSGDAAEWRKYYGSGVSESGAKTDIAAYLSGKKSPDSYSHGENSHDVVITSGLSYATNLNTIVTHMTQDVAEGMGNRHNTPASTIYNKVNLKAVKNTDDTKAYYRIVTSIDNNGDTYGYYYNSYALVLYDFELAPITSSGISYANTVVTTKDLSTSAGGSHKTYFENKSESSSNVTTQLTSSSTQTVSNSITSTKTYGFSETIGASAEWGNNFLGASKITASLSFTASQAISTAYGETKTLTDTYTNSATSSVTLPAHTAVALQQNTQKTTSNISYDCPVALRYKVAMFSMNGFRYDDRALTDYWTTTKDFCMILGTETSEGGYGASENLYIRAVNPNTKNKMERAFGQVEGNRNGRTVVSTIDWNKLSSVNDNISNVATRIPMFSSGASMDITSETTSTEMSSIMPLYPLAAIMIDAPNTSIVSGDSVSYKNMDYYKVDMSPGDYSYTNYIKLSGYNAKSIPYHGFVVGNGHWEVVDKEGNPLGDDAPVILEENPVSKNIKYTAVKPGKCFLKYFINENVYATAHDPTNYATNDDLLRTAALEINVSEDAFTGDVTVDGNYTGIVGDDAKPVDDADGLNVTITDSTGKEVDRGFVWEQKELPSKGMNLDGNNVTFTRPGTYHIRAVSGDMVSDWVEVTAVKKDLTISYEGDFENKIDNQTIAYNQAAELPQEEDIKLPTCKKFRGWYLDQECTRAYEEGTKLKEDTTLYAKIDHTGLNHIDEKQATHFEDGNIEYYECSVCGKCYTDAEGHNEIAKEDTIIPKLHFDGEITIEGSYTGIIDDDPQSIEGEDGLKVTVTDPTGKEIEEDYVWEQKELKSKGISLEEQGQITFTAPGTYHVRAVIGDYNSEWVEVSAIEKQLTVNYFNNLNTFEKSVNVSYNHAPELVTAEEMGLTECQTIEGWYLDEECTKKYDGSKIKEDINLYAKVEHDPLDYVEAKDATCTEKGNIEYYICQECKKYYSDAEGIHEITQEDIETPLIDHTWDDGVITQEPTENATGIKTYTCIHCGATKTEEIPKLIGFDSKLIKLKGTPKKNSITITWPKVKNADGFIIYGSKCRSKMKKLITVNDGSLTNYTFKKLKKGTYYKYKVAAYKNTETGYKIIKKSMSIHIVTDGGKFGNPTKLTVDKTNVTLKAKKKHKISANIVSNKKVDYHIAKFRYESEDTSVAKVNKKGTITGVKKGTTTIYVFTQNCLYKKIKVKVK